MNLSQEKIDKELLERAVEARKTCGDVDRLAALTKDTSELHLLFALMLQSQGERDVTTASLVAGRIKQLLGRLEVATETILKQAEGRE